MKEGKRQPRSYKATDAVYATATKRAKKEKIHLSNLIEDFVEHYGKGFSFKFIDESTGKATVLDWVSKKVSETKTK